MGAEGEPPEPDEPVWESRASHGRATPDDYFSQRARLLRDLAAEAGEAPPASRIPRWPTVWQRWAATAAPPGTSQRAIAWLELALCAVIALVASWVTFAAVLIYALWAWWQWPSSKPQPRDHSRDDTAPARRSASTEKGRQTAQPGPRRIERLPKRDPPPPPPDGPPTSARSRPPAPPPPRQPSPTAPAANTSGGQPPPKTDAKVLITDTGILRVASRPRWQGLEHVPADQVFLHLDVEAPSPQLQQWVQEYIDRANSSTSLAWHDIRVLEDADARRRYPQLSRSSGTALLVGLNVGVSMPTGEGGSMSMASEEGTCYLLATSSASRVELRAHTQHPLALRVPVASLQAYAQIIIFS